jgi:type VI secretion system ImpA family protein
MMTAYTTLVDVDWEELLAPITPECPAGESLRYEGTYDRIQEARRADDPDVPQGIWKTTLKKADWPAVEALCLEALAYRSKDLHLAVWLLEAWFHLYGLAGAQQGLALLRELCARFWDTLYPQLEDDDVEFRLAPFIWLNEKLALSFKQLPMTAPPADAPVYTWAEWENALHLDYVASKDQAARHEVEAAGKVTLARFRQSALLSPRTFYAELAVALQQALAATAACEELLQAYLGKHAPSFWQCTTLFEAMRRFVDGILAEHDDAETSLVVPGQHDGSGQNGTSAVALVSGGPIRSRADAYQRLQEAADYLLRTEPHSPTPYLVQRAVSWGHMTLVELLQELVGNEQDRRAIYALLGMQERR